MLPRFAERGVSSWRAMKDKLVEEFLGFLEVERNASPRTLRIYRDALRDFRAQTNAPGWRQCRAQHFRDYLFDLMKRKQARSYIRLQFSALRSFYRFLVARNRLTKDPVREIQLPKAEKKLPLVLTQTADRRTPRRPAPGEKAEERAGLDAAARCRDHGGFLQQRTAPGRARLAERERSRHLHGVGPGARQRTKGTRLSGRRAGACRRSRAIALRPTCTAARFFSTKGAGAFRRARSG